MPIYEYRCGACAHHHEALQKMSDAPLRKCPNCGKSQLKRLVSASQFRLKGGGWYETDFKNKSETKRNLVEHGGAETSEAGGDKAPEKAAKDESGKSVAVEKSGDTTPKTAEPKPASPKPAAPARKPAAKSRSRAARS